MRALAARPPLHRRRPPWVRAVRPARRTRRTRRRRTRIGCARSWTTWACGASRWSYTTSAGPIALPLALDDPGRVARLVVLNSWMWSFADDPRDDEARAAWSSGALGRFLYRRLNASLKLITPSCLRRSAQADAGDPRAVPGAVPRRRRPRARAVGAGPRAHRVGGFLRQPLAAAASARWRADVGRVGPEGLAPSARACSSAGGGAAPRDGRRAGGRRALAPRGGTGRSDRGAAAVPHHAYISAALQDKQMTVETFGDGPAGMLDVARR